MEAPRVHGPEALIVGFLFAADEEAIPRVYECPQHGCPVILTTKGVRIVRAGHVTCQRCLRPMYPTGKTVH